MASCSLKAPGARLLPRLARTLGSHFPGRGAGGGGGVGLDSLGQLGLDFSQMCCSRQDLGKGRPEDPVRTPPPSRFKFEVFGFRQAMRTWREAGTQFFGSPLRGVAREASVWICRASYTVPEHGDLNRA